MPGIPVALLPALVARAILWGGVVNGRGRLPGHWRSKRLRFTGGFAWGRKRIGGRLGAESGRRPLDVGGFQRGCGRIVRREHMPALLFHLFDFIDHRGYDLVEFLGFFQEVCYVQEGVAIEADFHESRLHAWQHAGYTAFVNASD